MRRNLKIIAVSMITMLSLGLTGCSADTIESSTSSSLTSEMAFDGSSTKYADLGNSQRSVVRSAQISIETKNLQSGVVEAKRLVAEMQGYVEWESLSSNDAGVPYAHFLQVRIPNREMDRVLDSIKQFGVVVKLETLSSDETATVIDLGARVKSQSASITRLEALVQQAETTSDLIEIENALAQRQEELESLQSQLKYLKTQVDYSTISISLFEEGKGPVSAPANFFDAVGSGSHALLGFLTGSIVALGFALPWIIALLPVVFVAWLVRRILRKGAKRI